MPTRRRAESAITGSGRHNESLSEEEVVEVDGLGATDVDAIVEGGRGGLVPPAKEFYKTEE